MEDFQSLPPATDPIIPPSPLLPKRSTFRSFFKNHRTFLSVFVLVTSLIVGAGIFTTVQLSQTNQDLRSLAATGERVSFSFAPAETRIAPSGEQTVQVAVNTNGQRLSAVVVPLTFDPQYISVTDVNLGSILPRVLQQPVIDNTAGTVQFTLGSDPAAPFLGYRELATLKIKAKTQPTDRTLIQYNANNLQAAVIGSDQNLAISEGNFAITIPAPLTDSCSRCVNTEHKAYVCPYISCDDSGNCTDNQPFCSNTVDNAENGGGVTCTYCGQPAAQMTAPGSPTAIVAEAGDGKAVVSFAAPANTGGSTISNYTVKSTPGGLTGTGTNSPITVPGLTNGTAYTFTVTATNATGTSFDSVLSNQVTPSAPVVQQPQPPQPVAPGAPTNVSATAGNTAAIITFAAPTNTGGSAITSHTVTANPGGITATEVASPIMVRGLTNGTAYTFTVIAKNAVGSGPASAPSNAVTPSPDTTNAGNPKLDLAFKLQGLNKAGVTIPAEVTVKYTPAGATPITKVYAKSYMSGENGVLIENSPIDILGFDLASTQGVATNTEIFVKTPTSLQKKIGVITLENNKVGVLHTDATLPVGDFKRGEGETNVIKLNDIALALTEYIQLENEVTDANREYDVDFSGVYNLQDIVIVLTNFEQLEYPGDTP